MSGRLLHFSGKRRIVAAAIASLALALAATLAACGGVSSATDSGTPATSANSSGCNKLSLLGLVGTDNIVGHIRYEFAFSNDGSSPCTLEGYPKVTLDKSITTVNTTSTATWTNVAIAPVTLEPMNGDGTLTPDNFASFAIQGYDQTTNCQLVNLTITAPQQTTSVPNESPIAICGGKLYVSPVVSGSGALNK
jgi:hypothetical protein